MSTEREQIKSLLNEHQLHLKKKLGQNFLVNTHVLETIAKAAWQNGEHWGIEIGPGLGTLTQHLACFMRPIVAIEKDRTLIPVVQTRLAAHPHVMIVEGNALNQHYADLEQVLPNKPEGRPAIFGNLPYNISAPLLFAMLDQRAHIGTVTVMLQKEVAERIVAPPGNKTYGGMSVLLQCYAEIHRVIQVAAENFMPPPKVDSTVIQFKWRPQTLVPLKDEVHFGKVVTAAFSQRRKMLHNALQTAFTIDAVAQAAAAIGLDLRRRAETLSVEEFAHLANALPAC